MAVASPECCELCGHTELEAVYRAMVSLRKLTIHLCRHCGLLQSLPRVDRAERRPAAASGGADWGNIRYGKGFRTEIALNALSRRGLFNAPLAVLDVGSNRGSFAKALLAAAPHAQLVAVEPDERVAAACADLPHTKLLISRIEDAALERERFDVVHSCHTIEHLAHPLHVLNDHWRVLKPGGLLILDAPSTAILDAPDIVEEWFIDKHLYHFSARTLMRMVTAAGFAILEPPDLNDAANVFLVAIKAEQSASHLAADPREVEEAERRIAAYTANRSANLAAMTAVAAEIAALASRRVAIWGAGRLFDSLVTEGGFAPAMLAGLIDAHLGQHLAERHGCAVQAPDALAAINPGVVIVMSRGFADEIAADVRHRVPGAEIITYGELISRARIERAA